MIKKLDNESRNTPNSDVVAVAGTIQRGKGAFARRLMTVRRGVGPGCCADSSDAIQSQRVWDQPGGRRCSGAPPAADVTLRLTR
jgi:hypothetical protein